MKSTATILSNGRQLCRNSFFMLATAMLFYSCNSIPVTGINKDLNTGMVTSYNGIKPGKTEIVMNGEILGHTQIPLGYDFAVINDHVEGLVVKDNKVSIGCSLIITDTTGKELLNEPDLFKENGLFKIDSAQALKCTVSTGKPMDWEQSYNVAIKFWDKYGSGTIENKLTISIIDIP